MTKKNSTPWPWRIEKGNNGFCETWQVTHVSTFKAKIIADCGPIQLVNHNNPNDIRLSEENKANAQLISAAPDMLEALERIKATFSWDELDGDELAQSVCKAIAKAKGEV